jgi:SAM-dependent methyltransferase
MKSQPEYIRINRQSWNNRVDHHLKSDFYDVQGFLNGKSSLKSIELELLGKVEDKSILHLQCHFGQDTISLARLGAKTTGVDLSDKAIQKARDLADFCNVRSSFICCDLYDLPDHLEEKFDIVFTSYGTVGWLPDLEKWAGIVSRFLKPDGQFVFVEFHPFVWMFDEDFREIKYNYFNSGAIIETENGTYADRNADLQLQYVMWNHSMGEVVKSLITSGLRIESLDEYDYSPYPCFKHVVETEPGKFRISHLSNKIPMVYAIRAIKKINKETTG